MAKRQKNVNGQLSRDRYIESVYHIVFFGNMIRKYNDTLSGIADKISSEERMTIRYSIQWNVMINTISLLDEINKFLFKYTNPADVTAIKKINSYKYLIEPILNDINMWPDLRRFRNNVLAHNFRIDSDDYKSVHLSNKLHTYSIPESSLDLLTLFKYLDSITRIAGELFSDEYLEALTIIESFVTPLKKNSTFSRRRSNEN